MVHPVRPNPKQNTVTNRGDAGKIEELSSQILELKVMCIYLFFIKRANVSFSR